MTTTTHTPGPWTHRTGTQLLEGSNGSVVCLVPFGEYDDADANARLIAAAPELLEILKRFVSVTAIGFEERDEAAEGEVWDAAQAAIAKAEGR